MKSFEQRSLIAIDCRGPFSGPNRLIEAPYIDLNQFWIEPELSSCRNYEIGTERVPDRVDRLIEGVPRKRARAFRPEVGLDPIAREPLAAAQTEDCEQTQRAFLLCGYRDWAAVAAQGKRSQKLEDEHFSSEELSDSCLSFF